MLGYNVSYAGTAPHLTPEATIPKPSVARSSAIMSAATSVSRITGFVRMWATAFALGATGLMSSYNVANNIPNMIYELAAGGIIAALFVPTFLELQENEGEQRATEFASHLLTMVVALLGLVAVVGTLFPAPFVWTQTFRLAADEQAVRNSAELFFRFFAIQVVVYGAGMVVQALLNARRRFLWPSVGPIFNNVVVIATMLIYVAVFPKDERTAFLVLAIGTTLGVVAMFAVQVPSLIAEGVRLRFALDFSDPAIRTMLKLAVPTVLYVATNLVSVSFRNSTAFAVSPEGPSVLAYAWTFYQLPYGIVAVSVATAIFTELAEAAGQKDTARYKEQLTGGLRATVTLVLPLAAMLIALAEPLVSLYRVGRFTAADVAPVAGALRWWALGLVFFATMMFLLRSFYALKDTKTPAFVDLALTVPRVALYTVLATGTVAWAGIGLNGIPIADGLFNLAMTATLAWLLRKKIGRFELTGVIGDGARMAVASAAGAAVAWGLAALLEPLATGLPLALMQLVVGGTAGLVVAFGGGRLLGVSDIDRAWQRLARLARRKRPE